jgi:hypothetical protein
MSNGSGRGSLGMTILIAIVVGVFTAIVVTLLQDYTLGHSNIAITSAITGGAVAAVYVTRMKR